MKKVISINLNGNAFQLEEGGFEVLDRYLKEARQQLANNPDREEILTDLEQAIADKCRRFLKPGKTVILSGEMEQIIEEMGPVRDGWDSEDTANEDTDSAGRDEGSKDAHSGQGASARRPRKLYRLKDDKMVEGVCAGIAAYLGIDSTIVRIIFVALLIISGGIIAIAYLVMAAIIPVAKTPEEHATAHGAPFDAQDIMDRARNKFQDFQERTDKTINQKSKAEYWRNRVPDKAKSNFGGVLTLAVVIIGVSVVLKFLFWPLRPDFMNGIWIHSYNPLISILVFIVLLYVLGRLIKNISASENGANSLLAGVLKFCLVVLVVVFAIRMFPILLWLIAEIVSFFRHILPPFHWW